MTRLLGSLLMSAALALAAPSCALADGKKTEAAPHAKRESKALDTLFAELDKAKDGPESRAVEAKIWDVWSHSGNPKVDRLLEEGSAAMARDDLDTALARFNMVVALAPDFAEGWNKRATLYYMIDEYDRSLADIAKTLALEPRHFGALSGLALVYRAKGDDKRELEALRRALKVNRHIPNVRDRIEELAQKVEGQGI
jgi:tetratricopeptide (TPR) repeat protein